MKRTLKRPMQRRDASQPIPGSRPARVEPPKIVIHEDVEQGTDEWFKLRAGIQTASNFGAVMAHGRDDDLSKTRLRYMHRLAAERLMGEPAPENYRNRNMERGKEYEPLAREQYERDRLVELRQVAFITREVGSGLDSFTVGASPDSLVGEDGGLEIKTELPELLVHRLEAGAHKLPPEHRAQVHGNIWVRDAQWWDLKIFWPKMPRFVVRFERDDRYIAEIQRACEIFEHELVRLVERLRRMG